MGYRSDVAYTITFRNKTTLNEFIALTMLKGEHHTRALSECEIVANDEHEDYRVNFFNDSVKWYDSYEDVQAHEENLGFVVERFPDDAAYRFIRIGEELEDNEDKMDGANDLIDWDLCVERGISLPFSQDYEPVGAKLGVIA